jgi:serine/threonine protein kinase
MSGANVLAALTDPEFYDSVDRFEAQENEFLDLVKQMVPADMAFPRVNGVWFGCFTPDERRTKHMPTQGWKIHMSATLSGAQDVLKAAVPVLIENEIDFKFSLDMRVLSLMNSKRWPRQGAGKFITIYPCDEDEFKSVIEQLYQATRQFEGPYILSDRRYKDSKVLFYRYGGMMPFKVLNIKGEKVPMLLSPSGENVPDVRHPYFHVPDWTKDPFEAERAADSQGTQKGSEIRLKEGRYVIKSSLSYTNSGGVYMADDTHTGQQVVIKEARPLVDSIDDTVSLLRKEHRLLSRVAHLNIAPKPLDFFQDWEHFFLVQERVKGTGIHNYIVRNNITLRFAPTIDDAREFYRNFKIIMVQLANIVKGIHECGIIFSDMSPGNLILDPDTMELKIIDFEGAFEVGVDKPGQLFTTGFAADQSFGRDPTVESDYFSIGAIIHYFLTPVNSLFAVNPKARYTFMQNVIRDIGFPESVYELATALIDKKADKRPTPDHVIEVLSRDEEVNAPHFATDGPEADSTYESYVKRITEYILGVATLDRRDRLFPSDGMLFRTNPLSIAYGACGVAYALNKIEHKIPEEVTNWILSCNKHVQMIPSGLYIGLGGIAWSMLELGLDEESRKVIASTHDHPLLYDAWDMFYGAAGWGMANLRFFAEFQDELYLQKAEEAGKYLLEKVEEDERGSFWRAEDGRIPLGYAHGQCGVSLFLLYLYLAGGQERFLDVGIKALDFEMNNSKPSMKGESISWMKSADEGHNIVYPYFKVGSAGVGTAMLRYYRLLREQKYRDMLEKIYIDTTRKYTLFPGMFSGLSGLGEFLLDLHSVTQESHHFDAAYRVATGISLFKIQKKQGLAFPGDLLRRISCDYGTGSAGVGHFLHRLTHREVEGAFNLDRLFAHEEQPERALAAAAA